MSQSAMSTPLIALNSTGPFRQYELTYDDCQMSSIWSTFRPIKNGLRYFSTAVCTDVGSLGERRAAQSVEARLAGRDLDDDQPDPIGSREDGRDVGDLQGRQAAAFFRGRLGRADRGAFRRNERSATGGGTGCQPTQNVAPIHDRAPFRRAGGAGWVHWDRKRSSEAANVTAVRPS